ncbi:uncharacterized protein LOC117822641 [Notolabrus celidotus]|uniref:uncharacterized protein LOC117822641 n=1 Tax=Notolabrus celidotus TaxID=1203425 RepID=UPI00148F51CB|nr:uncharacterized protein LOC117822641 [Notolabrus celidotus]XP_034553382.1 uncharacterized protein LOC117822641 [Notolabrus celidotus]
MKILLCVFLAIANMVATAPIRAGRENVLSFLEATLTTTTEQTIHTTSTVVKNPPSEPETEQESADMSEARSREGYGTNKFTDPDSHKTMEKGLSWRRTGSFIKDNTRLMGVRGRPTKDWGSRKHPGSVGAQQASREHIDLNSQEGLTVGARNVVSLGGNQVNDSANQGTKFQRKAAPGRVPVSNVMLTQGQSREVVDLDSLEENNGRHALTDNRGHADIDETRELFSSETYPAAPPGHMPSGSTVPVKSRTS